MPIPQVDLDARFGLATFWWRRTDVTRKRKVGDAANVGERCRPEDAVVRRHAGECPRERIGRAGEIGDDDQTRLARYLVAQRLGRKGRARNNGESKGLGSYCL
jgi:hypothetical protein